MDTQLSEAFGCPKSVTRVTYSVLKEATFEGARFL